MLVMMIFFIYVMLFNIYVRIHILHLYYKSSPGFAGSKNIVFYIYYKFISYWPGIYFLSNLLNIVIYHCNLIAFVLPCYCIITFSIYPLQLAASWLADSQHKES